MLPLLVYRTTAHIDHETTELSKCCLRPKYTKQRMYEKKYPPTVVFITIIRQNRQEKPFITIFTYPRLIWCTIGTFLTKENKSHENCHKQHNSGKKTL